MLSNASKYAIRAVVFIAKNAQVRKCRAQEIADSLDIPAPFLSKILQELTKKKIISSVKGPNGGFFVSQENKEKTILEIIESIDGIHKFNECFLGELECNDKNPCMVHHLYSPFKEGVLSKLNSKTIEKIIQKEEDLKGIL